MGILLSRVFPLFLFAQDFEILGATTPSVSARGFYFTYSIRVKRADKGDIRQLVKNWKPEGKFRTFEGDEMLPKEGGYWAFPFPDRPGEGLLQILFFTDMNQPAGPYEYEGKLVKGGQEISLPTRSVEVSRP